MTPAPPLQNEYIVTDMQIRRAMAFMNRDCEMDADEWIEMDKSFRSRPHTTTPSEREQMLDILDDFIDGNKIMVHDEEVAEADYMNLTGEIRAKIAELRTTTEAHR